MAQLVNIAERIFNTPLLIHPGKAEAILWGLRERLAIEVPEPDASRFLGTSTRPDGSYGRVRQEAGVALIDVYGTLVNRGPWPMLNSQSGLTSYEGLRAQLSAAAKDRAVNSVVLVMDSPGGEAGGMKATADAVAAVRNGGKRVIAVVDDMAASAAYGIASAADEIWISQTSTLGSIGVVLVHMDHSGELQLAGVRPTIIKAGAKKATGNPFQALSQDDIAELAGLVAQHYDAFLKTVADGRGRKLTAKAARATEAAVFVGQDAIARGLADRMGTVEEAVSYLAKRNRGAKGDLAATGGRGGKPISAGATGSALRAFRVSIFDGSQPELITASSGEEALARYVDGLYGSAAAAMALGHFAVEELG